MFRRFIALFAGLLLSAHALSANTVPLNNNHPEQYTVQPGDTLWDISAMFLQNPWQWPNIWEANPQIENPHLIYPGDVLELAYVDGKAVLRLRRNGGTIKLSPQIRATPLDVAIPSIPIKAIAPFLTRPYVLEEGQAEESGYIVALADEHLVGGADQAFYARRIDHDKHNKFDIVRPDGAYKDADTGEILGYKVEYVGSSSLIRKGDPATLKLNNNNIEMLAGDRLIPVNEEESFAKIFPHVPQQPINGSIIDVLRGVTQIGQYQVVVIDRGQQDGLRSGDVLVIDNLGETIRDRYHGDVFATVKLPNEVAGELLIFRIFDRISFGIVMSATRAMHVRDKVHSPE